MKWRHLALWLQQEIILNSLMLHLNQCFVLECNNPNFETLRAIFTTLVLKLPLWHLLLYIGIPINMVNSDALVWLVVGISDRLVCKLFMVFSGPDSYMVNDHWYIFTYILLCLLFCVFSRITHKSVLYSVNQLVYMILLLPEIADS